MPVGMDSSDSDNKIIATALKLKLEGQEVLVYSRDINMRVKCDSFGVPCSDYQPRQVIKSVDKLFDGMQVINTTSQIIDQFYVEGGVMVPEDAPKLFPNQYLLLMDETNKKSAMARFINDQKPVQKVIKYKNIWGLSMQK